MTPRDELKLSMWTSFFIDLSPEDALRELARAGWRYAELSDEHGKALLERGDPAAVGGAFRRFAQDSGVAVEQGHLWLTVDIAPADEATRRQTVAALRRWLDLYLALQIPAAVIHPGGAGLVDPAARLEAQVRTLDELAAHVRGSGLVLCVENCSSGDALRPLLAATPPDAVGVCLDTGHLNLTAESQAAFIRACGPRLRALHLAENDKSGDQHNLPYARGGSVPWGEVAEALAQASYQGLLNFEVPGENRCPLPVRRLKLAYLQHFAGWIFARNAPSPC
ncbi:MAG TPA: sugar phosphate isomerase/epimerase [Planctomycetota bacterium]|nr:sugar phosphate isomerase/epimerase [Planctomycetota bacterium]HRR79814.1 sugar phosphate isomerase/epimerase [Planctomycetota bacterium]HRT96135.1 sugar phosphate isomerase/epimerase [Planctomycetota bacterium]